jgi:hypothetical protein
MKKNLLFFLLIVFSIISSNLLFSRDFNFFTRVNFSNAQFWERQVKKHENSDSRKVFTSFFNGSAGVGLEFIIWDIGKERGSRLFIKHGVDLVFSGIHFAGAYNDRVNNVDSYAMYELNTNGGALFTGVDWDFYFGGTFPKTDILWGIGCMWYFLFPSYSPKYNVAGFVEKWHFYAVPSVFFGYDFIIPNTKFKITPHIKGGFTCNPLIPDDLIRDMHAVGGDYVQVNIYSGAYFEAGVSFTFTSVRWRK